MVDDANRHTILADELIELIAERQTAFAYGSVPVVVRNMPSAIVTIHNQGAIPEDIRDRFFDKYSTSGKKQGTGLGTYSARLLTEVQNGRIEFESSEEAGTTLKVSMPLS